MAILNFDASQVEPQKAMEIIPAGWYLAQMVASAIQPTKDQKGAYLETEYEVMAPAEHKGRKLFDRFNLQNANPTAVEIAYRALSAVCHAVGVIQCQDSQQLHARPLMVKVKVVPAAVGADGKQYESKNEVSGYKPAEQNSNMGSGPAPSWANSPAPAAVPAGHQFPTTGGFAPAPAQQAPTAAPTPPWGAQPQTPVQQPAPAPQPWQQPAQTAPAAATPPWAAAVQPAAPNSPPWAK